jgi:hypothetical protein
MCGGASGWVSAETRERWRQEEQKLLARLAYLKSSGEQLYDCPECGGMGQIFETPVFLAAAGPLTCPACQRAGRLTESELDSLPTSEAGKAARAINWRNAKSFRLLSRIMSIAYLAFFGGLAVITVVILVKLIR